VEVLANGVQLQMSVNGRAIKRRRHDEVQPYLRDYISRVGMLPLPADEPQLFAMAPPLDKLTTHKTMLEQRSAQQAAQQGVPAPPPLFTLPEGVTPTKVRARIGRLGRLILDRVDPLTFEPLPHNAPVVEDLVASHPGSGIPQPGGGTEAWFEPPKLRFLQELLEECKPPAPPLPRPTPPAQVQRLQQSGSGAAAQRLGSAALQSQGTLASGASGVLPSAVAAQAAGSVGPGAPGQSAAAQPVSASTAQPPAEPRQAHAAGADAGSSGGADGVQVKVEHSHGGSAGLPPTGKRLSGRHVKGSANGIAD